MLNMVIFLCIVSVLTSIFIGLILFKEYSLIKYYIKREEDFNYFHAKIRELESGGIQSVKNNPIHNHSNSILNQKHELTNPKIISDNKIYSQEEFSKEINNGKFQMSSLLQAKLHEKNRQKANPF